MIVYRLVERLLVLFRRASWVLILVNLGVLYALGAVVMRLAEAPDSGFASLANYSWWFLVTVTTVGYGDLAPASEAGRAAAAVIMLLGIGAIGAAVGKLFEAYFEIGRSRMRGTSQLELSGHIVILGYREGETEKIVEELLADSQRSHDIALCSGSEAENPLPGRVHFVKGDLTADDVLERACVGAAELIVIHRDNDSDTIVCALACTAANPRAHIVVRLETEESRRHIARINPRIECVVSLTVPMLVQALQDPGITEVMQRLLSNVQDDVLFKLSIPESAGSWSFDQLLRGFKERYEAIPIGVSRAADPDGPVRLNPPAGERVEGGASLFYIAARRLSSVDWSAF